MKRLVILFFLFGITVTGQEQSIAPEIKLPGFNSPESVIYDENSEYFYISNMAEGTKGDGFISRISRKWKKQEQRRVEGLNEPKGLVVKAGKLYVTDVNILVEIDLETGEIIREIPVEGAKSLNDSAIDENGVI